jgi:peptidyl-prolyl cis-trans isomerase C
MEQMKSLQLFLYLTPVACLLAQTPPHPQTPPSRTITLPPAPGQPAAVKPPTVTLSAENPPSAFPSVPPDTVVLTINDKKITAGELEHMIDIIPEHMRNQARTTGRRQFAENVVRIEVMAQEGLKRKLEDTPAFKDESAFQRDNLLAQTLYREMIANKVDDAALHAYYDQHKKDYEEVKARHILVRFKGSPVPARAGQKELTEEEALAKAQDIRKKLLDGADFAELAKKESDDVGSGANGGELGTFGRGRMVPPFEQAAFSLEVGKISEPVKSQFGYHIIKVEEHKEKSFAEVRPELERKLEQETAQKEMEKLKDSATVVMNPAYFGPAPGETKPEPKPEAKPPATPHSK